MAAPSCASASADQGMQEQQSQKQPLIMQIIVDRNLVSSPEWSLGPLMTQAAHAATAATVSTLETSPLTRAYVSTENLPQMHKVVLQTPEKGAMSDLRALSAKLAEGRAQWEADRKEGEQGGLDNDDHWFPEHYLWIEQPENVPTCIAVAPNRKPPVSEHGCVQRHVFATRPISQAMSDYPNLCHWITLEALLMLIQMATPHATAVSCHRP